MAGRKDKNIVDYFPHLCGDSKTIFILESKYGNNGYSVWYKTLEILGKSENHYIDCRNTDIWEYMQAKMKLMSAELQQIYDTCVALDAIHKELWENKVIWSSNFIKNIDDVYKRRNNKCMHFNDICKHLSIKCKHKYNNEGIIENINTQSKVKESKVNNKEKEIFDIARKIYLGTKRGLDTEFENFKKKHKDWKEVLSLLKPAIQNQIQWHKEKKLRKEFVPEWKNFQTWINQRCWEEESPKLNEPELEVERKIYKGSIKDDIKRSNKMQSINQIIKK